MDVIFPFNSVLLFGSKSTTKNGGKTCPFNGIILAKCQPIDQNLINKKFFCNFVQDIFSFFFEEEEEEER